MYKGEITNEQTRNAFYGLKINIMKKEMFENEDANGELLNGFQKIYKKYVKDFVSWHDHVGTGIDEDEIGEFIFEIIQEYENVWSEKHAEKYG